MQKKMEKRIEMRKKERRENENKMNNEDDRTRYSLSNTTEQNNTVHYNVLYNII